MTINRAIRSLSNKSQLIYLSVQSLIIFCSILIAAFSIWSLDRGFEISDESYYLLLAMQPESTTLYISTQQWITAFLWDITGSLTLFRASGLALLLVGSSILALGVHSCCIRFKIFSNSKLTMPVLLACSAVLAMLYASTINYSPSYNLIASAGAYAASGMILLATSQPHFYVKKLLIIVAGIALALVFMGKLTAGISTLALLLIWISYFGYSNREKIFSSTLLLTSTLLSIGFILLSNTTIADASTAFNEGMQLFKMVQVEAIGTRLLRYTYEYGRHVFTAVLAFILPFIALLLYTLTGNKIFARGLISTLLLTLIFGGIVTDTPSFSLVNASSEGFLFGGVNRYTVQMSAIFTMLLLTCLLSIQVLTSDKRIVALLLFLFSLPYAVAMGTGNTLFTQAIISLSSWGLFIAILLLAKHSNTQNKNLLSIVSLCFIITISIQIISSSFRPYHMTTPLSDQNQAYSNWSLGPVKVDPETHTFLSEMKSITTKCNITPNTLILALYDIPGISLILETKPPITPWLNNSEQADFILERMSPSDIESSVLAIRLNHAGEIPELPKYLNNFPDGYQHCGTSTFPFIKQIIQIWKPL